MAQLGLDRSAYPIPLKGDEPKWWTFYQGKIGKNGVEIDEKINEIYSNGFFGKGALSKNAPVFETLPSRVDDESEMLDKSGLEIQAPEEKLILSFEEAFFLMYAVPCITVSENEKALNLDEAWKRFSDLSNDRSFPIYYSVYHHFRSKGWAPKSGLKYGVDYVIYKDGPTFNHSQYSVVVTIKGPNEPRSDKLTWLQLAALKRVNINCGKEILFCNVWAPENVDTAECLRNFKIEEFVFKRWVASEERTNKDVSSKETKKVQKNLL